MELLPTLLPSLMDGLSIVRRDFRCTPLPMVQLEKTATDDVTSRLGASSAGAALVAGLAQVQGHHGRSC